VPVKLLNIPVVRRIEYLDDYLKSIEQGCYQDEIEEVLAERKRYFEREKILAVGRGNPYRKGIERTKRLAGHCRKLSKELGFTLEVDGEIILTEKGVQYLDLDCNDRRFFLCESFSRVYPHLGTLINSLNNNHEKTITAPMLNKPPFRPEIARYGMDIGQVAFDTLRDIATGIGVVNWYYTGIGVNRRQHIYLTCSLSKKMPEDECYKVFWKLGYLYLIDNNVDIDAFKDVLWNIYLDLNDGIPGSPVFYSTLRERVCYHLRIRDIKFNSVIMELADWDDDLRIVPSEGVLPRLRDSASMLKSLPPKTDYGNYIVFLKIMRRD